MDFSAGDEVARHELTARKPLPPAAPAALEHRVQFYKSPEFLGTAVGGFLAEGVKAGQPLLVIARPEHRQAFCRHLETRGVDHHDEQRSGRLTFLDARETLATFMVDDMPDWDLFRQSIGAVLARTAVQGRGPTRAYGEMVDILSREGHSAAALRLEELWNELGRTYRFELLCAYALETFSTVTDGDQFQSVCRLHSHVTPAEDFVGHDDREALSRQISVLQQRARSLETELVRRRELEDALRDRQQELADFFESAVEGLHWVDADGIILWANRAELELLGYQRDEYVGRSILEFHADREVIEDLLARLRRQETLRNREARLRCKDGSIKHVLISSNALFRDGQFLHTRCFTRDVTDRKRLDQELVRRNEDLARIVRFTEMFVGILGHDLRNPVSAVSTGAALLLRRYQDEGVAKPARRILSSAERMGRMIDQLLDFTRIRLGQGLPLSRRSTDLANLCRMAGEEADARASSPIQLTVTGDLVGSWDSDRLAQLASNLIGNALAHGDRGTPVLIHLDGERADEVRMEVANEGVIPLGLLPVIFEPFRTGTDTKTERSGGLGLGLYISQQIVMAHGGTISVRSSVEEGTRFTIRLPRQAREGTGAFTTLGERAC
jgi:PAS domain S-box-containing protein